MAESSEQNPLRIAIAGLGKMGVMHAAMVRAIPGAEVAGLVDADAATAKQVRSMGADAPFFSSIEACLAEAKPAGVIISTPQSTHRALAEACLAAGVAVMCEKPLAHTIEDARAMARRAAAMPGTVTAVGLMLGHHPLFERAAAIVREGVLGEIKAARASCYLSQVFSPKKGWTFTKSAAGGGVVINSGSHLLYVILRVLGPVAGVIARGRPVHNEVEDTLMAIADMRAGFSTAIDISWSVPGHEFQTHDLKIEGTGGTLEVGNQTLRLWLTEARGGFAKGWTELKRAETEPIAAFTLSPDYCGDEFYLEDLDFIEAIRQGRPAKIDWAQGLAVQEFVDAIYRSAESGATTEVASG